MTDNPYPTAAQALAQVAPAGRVKTALSGADANDIAARLAVVELVREQGVAIRATAGPRRLVGAVTGIVGASVAVGGFFAWRDPGITLAAAGWMLAVYGVLWLWPTPILVLNRRGIWLIQRFRTDFCDWNALKSIVRDTDADGEIVFVFKPDALPHHCAVFRGAVRIGQRTVWSADLPADTPPPIESGPRIVPMGFQTASLPTSGLQMVLTWCLLEFGTPTDVSPPRPPSSRLPIVIDEAEFDDSDPT